MTTDRQTDNKYKKMNNLCHHLFRLPLFIMGVAAGLLSLRGLEYSRENSWIFFHLSPWTCAESRETSINRANPKVWASKTDRCSLVLIFIIIYSTVVSTFNLTVREHFKFSFRKKCQYNFLAYIPSTFYQRPHSIVLLPSSAGCDRGPDKR